MIKKVKNGFLLLQLRYALACTRNHVYLKFATDKFKDSGTIGRPDLIVRVIVLKRHVSVAFWVQLLELALALEGVLESCTSKWSDRISLIEEMSNPINPHDCKQPPEPELTSK